MVEPMESTSSENKEQSPIFVGGCGRSGTTLLRVILDSHPNIACGPEFKAVGHIATLWKLMQSELAPILKEYYLDGSLINSEFAELFRRLLDRYRIKMGKQRIAEKTPNNVFFFQFLFCLFPRSPLVHVIRDGRDVICSLLKMNWFDLETGQRRPETVNVKDAAEYWVRSVSAGRMLLQNEVMKRNYIEIKYEDIVSDSEATLRNFFSFIGEPWHDDVLSFYQKERSLAGESSAEQVSRPLYSSSIGRWKKDLPEDSIDGVKEIIGPLLIDLKYEANNDW